MTTKQSKKITSKKQQRIPLWLPVIMVAGLVLLVIVIASGNNNASPAAPVVTGAPALQVDKEKVDFGNVTLGQTVEVKFEVTNVGDQSLRFTRKPYVEVVEGC
ncbi:hypothetical protein TFLX_03758 [Thermoflexales bacterium]|nr:hypothetical protein TFLX_03758 [Thermoflexales bacterium]